MMDTPNRLQADRNAIDLRVRNTAKSIEQPIVASISFLARSRREVRTFEQAANFIDFLMLVRLLVGPDIHITWGPMPDGIIAHLEALVSELGIDYTSFGGERPLSGVRPSGADRASDPREGTTGSIPTFVPREPKKSETDETGQSSDPHSGPDDQLNRLPGASGARSALGPGEQRHVPGEVPVPDTESPRWIEIRPRTTVSSAVHWKEWIIPPEVKGSHRMLGAFLKGVAIIAGLAVLWFHNHLKTNTSKYLNITQGSLYTALAYSTLVGLGGLLTYLFKIASRARASHAVDVLNTDHRAPILLLRAFKDDCHELDGYSKDGNFLTFGQRITGTFEEYLSETLSQCGPVIAIGRPGEWIAPLGAHRFWVTNDKWKDVVIELLGEAQYVVLIMGELNPGLAWEVQHVAELRDLEKVILVMPPLDETRAKARWESYRPYLGHRLPEYQGGEIAVTFRQDRDVQVIRVRKTGMLLKDYYRDLAAYSGLIVVGNVRPPAPAAGPVPQPAILGASDAGATRSAADEREGLKYLGWVVRIAILCLALPFLLFLSSLVLQVIQTSTTEKMPSVPALAP